MTFLALLAALAIEQAWPLRRANPVHRAFARYAYFLESRLNSGRAEHGAFAWLLAVLPPVLAIVAVHEVLEELARAAAWLWSVAVLYYTVGFRRFSHHFHDIEQALRDGDIAAARSRLERWRGEPASELSRSEIARVAIEQGLLASHRNVFAPALWFVVLGPGGAMLYHAAVTVAERWSERIAPETAAFERFARRALHWLDWIPARVTAAGFAVVGDFEDAIYCWRSQAPAWEAQADGIILAAGGGAMGVRLGAALHQDGILHYRPELGIGEEVDPEHMHHAVGLIWRTLVLAMFLVLLVSLAYALG